MSDYKDDYPVSRQDKIKEVRESNNTTGGDNYAERINPCFETKGPQRKHFRVLYEDGSLADIPDSNVEGAGVGDGTIGR